MDAPDPDEVHTLPDLVGYLKQLAKYREQEPEEWQNYDVGDYLDAIAAWLEATPNLREAKVEKAEEIEQERPTWRGVAILFYVGTIYE